MSILQTENLESFKFVGGLKAEKLREPINYGKHLVCKVRPIQNELFLPAQKRHVAVVSTSNISYGIVSQRDFKLLTKFVEKREGE